MDAIDKINFYLSKKGKNGADLSRALGLSNSIYSQWNTRKTKPSNARLPAIAEYLGVSVEDIMPDDVAAPAASEGAKKSALDPKTEGEGLSAAKKALLVAIDDLSDAQCEKLLPIVLSAKQVL